MSTTLIIIAFTVIVSIYAFNNQTVFYKWIMNPYTVKHNKEYFRFISSGLIHSNYMHLGFNMFTLFFFGDVVEREFQSSSKGSGTLIFVIFYVSAIIISEIPTYLKHKNNSNYNSLGASGGVAAVVFSSIMYDPLAELRLYGLIRIPGFILGILYLGYSFYMSKESRDNINHDAHLYGAIYGVLFTIALDPSQISKFFTKLSEFSLFG